MQDYNNIKVNFDHFIQSLKTTTDDLEFRKKSFNHFLQKGYPVTKDENWKYSPLTKDLKKFTKNPEKNWEVYSGCKSPGAGTAGRG